MTSRQRLDERNEMIRSDILRMGDHALEMVRLAVESVVSGDLELARRVIAMDDQVDELERSTVQRTIVSVGMDSPVASDLMVLIATLAIIGEVEKVADDAVKLARRATKLVGHFPAELKLALSQLGEASSRMFGAALRLYGDYSESLADEIISSDKAIDRQYREARDLVVGIIQKNPSEAESLLRTVEAFHALEHVADRAVEVANRLRMHNR